MNRTARPSTAVIISERLSTHRKRYSSRTRFVTRWIRVSAHYGRQALLTIATIALLGNVGVVHAQWKQAGNQLTTVDTVGVGTAAPAASLDVGAGLLHVAGTITPTTTEQGAYLGWNALTGGTGETDFINNEGAGIGGFAFMNTPTSGHPRTTLMLIAGDGTFTIPAGRLLVANGNGTVMDVVAAINYILGQLPN
jgi:hypothetical protein